MSRALEALWMREHEARIAAFRPKPGDEPEVYTKPGPKGPSLDTLARMRAMRDAGALVSVIAKTFGMSTRQTGRLLRGRR